jgi:hypothetical protein
VDDALVGILDARPHLRSWPEIVTGDEIETGSRSADARSASPLPRVVEM